MPWIAAAGAVVAGALGANAAEESAEASAQATREATAENRRQYDITRSDTALSRSLGQGALYKLAQQFGLGVNNQARIQQLERSRSSLIDRLSRAERGQNLPGPESLAKYGFDSVDDWMSAMRNRLNNVDRNIQNLSRPTSSGSGGGLYDNLKMDPGYEFRLSENEKALQRMQSAGGTRYGGGALKAALRYGQDYASNEFSNAVNRRNAELGYLFSLAGFGQQGIATAGQAGAESATNNSNILMQNAALQGNATMTGASAINNAVQGGIQNYYTQQLLRDYNRNPATTNTMPSHEATH